MHDEICVKKTRNFLTRIFTSLIEGYFRDFDIDFGIELGIDETIMVYLKLKCFKTPIFEISFLTEKI